ncbi:alpha/beta fold hydrolase [Caulobacter sp. 17J80-11]|uniref:alpha/beta fold hydrolase n=1 Tax=Caulobacter sp. 17J80-11 TaxID=2763502 RepID=UPI0016537788|nr:alpha/beta hydrolase [Caulobacter sp. 17J80-11]MBC6983021.1 alpha/beta hydrolase [Caulobacter sp. 17J80-11]
MHRRTFLATTGAIAVLAAAVPAGAATPGLPPSFKTKTVTSADGTQIHVGYGGSGPAVVLIHGYADTGDMWGPLAADLAKNHTVIVPDLRGLGRSARPAGGYDKKTQAQDIRAAVTGVGADRSSVVAHDIGNMVAYAYVATYPDKVDKLVVMDAPLPGVPPWDEIICKNKLLWHFNVRGPDMERLVAGRERIWLDRFWDEFSADPSKIDEATRAHYAAQYAQPGAIHAGFEQFAAFEQDAKDNQAFMQTKLTVPVLAIGGEKSFGPQMAAQMRNVATNVQAVVVPNSGHWLMEENPAATVKTITAFLNAPA